MKVPRLWYTFAGPGIGGVGVPLQNCDLVEVIREDAGSEQPGHAATDDYRMPTQAHARCLPIVARCPSGAGESATVSAMLHRNQADGRAVWKMRSCMKRKRP